MCGLAFFNGSKPANLIAMRMLGVLNEERGTHSCGVYLNGGIKWGVDKQAHFREFSAANDLSFVGDDYNMLIHTRASTYGQHTVANAHPFGIKVKDDRLVYNDLEGPYDFVGMHNGTLESWSVTDLRKVEPLLSDVVMDSKVLLGRIMLDDDLQVLSQYEGAAALAWVTGKNKLCVFKGANNNIEERPLYYCYQPEGMYFSSLEKSLKSVFPGTEIFPVKNNQVLYLENGKIVKDEIIERKIKYYTRGNFTANTTTGTTSTSSTTKKKEKHPLEVFDVFEKASKNRVYMHWLRYWFKDDLLNGAVKLDQYGKKNTHGTMRYFIQGIEFKDKASYEKFLKIPEGWELYEISKYTTHPIVCFEEEDFWTFNAGFVYKDGTVFTGQFEYPFARTLTLEIKSGVVKGVVVDTDAELGAELEALATKIAENAKNKTLTSIGVLVQQICALNDEEINELVNHLFQATP